MSITISDPSLFAQLLAVRGPVEVRGPDGEHVGTFQPFDGKLPPGVKSPFTDEQMAEFRKQRTGRPLADILRDLESGGS